MRPNLPILAAGTGAVALAVYTVSQIALIFAYRAYYARRRGAPCELPLFRLWRRGPTILDNIRQLEFRDRTGWGLRSWLILFYGAQLALALSLVAFFIGMFAGP